MNNESVCIRLNFHSAVPGCNNKFSDLRKLVYKPSFVMRKSIITGLLIILSASVSWSQDITGLVARSSFPGTGTVIIFDSTRVHVEESGLSHVYTHRLYKVQTAGGAKGLSVIKYDYDPLSAWSQIQRVVIYRADGSRVELDTSKVLDYPQPARAIYWGAREKMLAVGKLEPGDALEVFLYRKGFTYALLSDGPGDDDRYAPPMRGHFYDIVPFWSSDPVLVKSYEVSIPKTKTLQYEVYNGALASKAWINGDRMVYTFSAKDIKPWKGESRSVDASDIAPKLLLSTSPDWKAKSLWFYSVNEEYGSFKSSPEIKKKVDELVRNARDEYDSVSILTHWVADEIRYLGLTMGKGEGYTLHKGEMDFTDRCGVCKDKAGMLITMLRAAGFEAYPAMTMAGSRIDYIPADQFNHCVSVVKSRRDGKYHLLDPTWVPFIRELWSSAEQQQNYLMGVPEGADLAETPLSDPAKHYLRISGMSVISADGTLEGEYTVTAEGQIDASIRGIFTRGFIADRAAALEKEILRISPQAQVLAVNCEDPVNYMAAPISLHYSIRIPDYAIVTNDELIFTPFVMAGFFNRAQPHTTFSTNMDKREYPFRDRTSHAVSLSEKIVLPAAAKTVVKPDNDTDTGPGATFRGEYSVEDTRLLVNFTADYPKRIYQPEDWPSFRKAVEYQNKLASSPVRWKMK